MKAGTLGARVGRGKDLVPAGGTAVLPAGFVIAGGTRATICWSLAARQFQR